jgi:hypothetical protein
MKRRIHHWRKSLSHQNQSHSEPNQGENRDVNHCLDQVSDRIAVLLALEDLVRLSRTLYHDLIQVQASPNLVQLSCQIHLRHRYLSHHLNPRGRVQAQVDSLDQARIRSHLSNQD